MQLQDLVKVMRMIRNQMLLIGCRMYIRMKSLMMDMTILGYLVGKTTREHINLFAEIM